MSNNLALSYVALPSADETKPLEEELRLMSKPPFNRDGQTAEQLHVSRCAAAMQGKALGAKSL